MQLLDKIRRFIPPLGPSMHKGQAGRIGVIGGSAEYTGAPFFSAISSMKLGADLAHVICEPKAATAIKSYSPGKNDDSVELADTAIERIASLLGRLHVLVVGPGLSRDEYMQRAAYETILMARDRHLPMVIDADGLYLVQHHPELIRGYNKAVLTPNVVEFQRLCTAMVNSSPSAAAEQLSHQLGGVTIVQKGSTDIIAQGSIVLHCDVNGSLKRCGGQGDILGGLIATFIAWTEAYKNQAWNDDNSLNNEELIPLACYAGCWLVRSCAREAFKQHQRATLTSDMLVYIGQIFDEHLAHL
ncbi:YjeF domain-containing protein [Syncephalis plumigaleata]|nr:YjeF domain-containing protein [Syncephalis plumigaleata]